MELRGIFLPATTPFDPIDGELDVVALRGNLRAWSAAGLAGVVLFGSTGEGLLLDEEERARALDAAGAALEGSGLLLAGTGAESTRATIRLTRAAAAGGADAALVQPPAYYRPQMTAEALREHFVAVAEASPIPIVLYQVPTPYSGIELQAGLVAELSRHPNVVGIKDSSGDLKALGALVTTCPGGFSVLVGSGAVAYGALEVGASGGILAIAALAPTECARLYEAFAAGRHDEAGRIQERLVGLHRGIVGGMGVPGVKAALDELGLRGGEPRMPLRPLAPRERAKVPEILERAGLGSAARRG